MPRRGFPVPRGRSQADVQALERALRDSPVFRHGSPSDLAALAAQATPFDYPPGSFLMRQGEPANFVLVLTAGEVAIVSPVRGGAEQVHSIVRRSPTARRSSTTSCPWTSRAAWPRRCWASRSATASRARPAAPGSPSG